MQPKEKEKARISRDGKSGTEMSREQGIRRRARVSTLGGMAFWFGCAGAVMSGTLLALAMVTLLVLAMVTAVFAAPLDGPSQGPAWVLPAPRVEKATQVSLVPGTPFFIRLETGVSVSSSHLHGPVTARVVREVPVQEGAAIPLGAVVRGGIEKLIPSSGPTDRARLRVQFTHLEIPGAAPLAIACHVVEVENARETILPDGTIQGLLASELPVNQLERALEKLGKSNPQAAERARKEKEKLLGQSGTAIEYPPGTDLRLVLDEPLKLDQVFSPAASDQLPRDAEAAIEKLLADAPQRTTGENGKPGNPLNLVMVGSEQEIRQAFGTAGWTEPARKTSKTIWETIRAMAGDAGYDQAPVSDLYLYGKREELAFQKLLNTFAKRHHLRLWRSPVKTSDGREVWLGEATRDKGIDVHPEMISHAIDPEIDVERAKVAADLILSGIVSARRLITRPNPLTQGLTATGGPWKTDGRLLAIELKGPRL